MIGAVLGAAVAVGLLLAWTGQREVRRPRIEARVLPYVRDLPSVADSTPESEVWVDLAAQFLRRTRQRLSETVSGTAAVQRRLDRLGDPESLADFRARQWSYGIGGFLFALAFCLMLVARSNPPVPALLVVCGIGFLGGLVFCDQRLSARLAAHEKEMAAEFPIITDLLALSVAAGESPVAAVERVVTAGQGALTQELSRVLADIRSGCTVPAAFDALAARTGVSSIARFAEAMSVAVERGTPLIEVLHAQAGDAREATRRELIESAGRREIVMLMPVVFMILPLVIVFAFYPGMVSLQFSSGG